MNEIEISDGQSIREVLGIKKRRKVKCKPFNRHTRKLIWIRFKNRMRAGYYTENDPNALYLSPRVCTEAIYLKNGIDLRSFEEKE